MDFRLPAPADALPHLCGSEHLIERPAADAAAPSSSVPFGPAVRSAFAIALHMHQPLIPAGRTPDGSGDPRRAGVIGNLQFMLEHPEVKDAHNAPAFLNCYKRMGDLIPQLLREGKRPRVMLDYSGCLLHGLRQMGATYVLDALRHLVDDAECQPCVEWIGTAWGHAVAPSTPPRDFELHVRAWRLHFASEFGPAALGRVRGFSPPEMALPNHPDVCHAFVRTLRDAGYRWVLVQEHTIERADGGGPIRRPHVPHRLVARNSRGETATILAVIKTQGSDTKLVGQMQPYAEAKGLARTELGGRAVPPLVTQIADGENGGVMMNEFPSAFLRATREASDSETPPMNVSEYLDHLAAAGVRDDDLPAVRPLFHDRIWSRFADGAGPDQLEVVLAELRGEDPQFHVEGGSWTGDISWVRGYEGLLGPMESASARFAEATRDSRMNADNPRYREALYHLLLSQTSCFRYWGEGEWADHGRELCRRATAALDAPA